MSLDFFAVVVGKTYIFMLNPILMEKEIVYSLIRSKKRKRTLSLRIMQDGRVIMQVPYRTSQEEIDSFFEAKTAWVKKKLLERESRVQRDAVKPIAFIPGERFLYLGEWYPLEFQNTNGSRIPLSLSWGTFVLDETRAEQARDFFIKWYKAEAKRLLADRVNYYSNNLVLSPKSIRITSALLRYGSCSPDNKLSFSWRLVMTPLAVMDYVIIHELMHIKEKNHSARFWGLVESAMPDYKKHRHWLRDHGHLLKV
jgi:predicted metal-dependent hydrolase